MKELKELIAQFAEAYIDAPLYGGYSRTLKRKIQSKGDLQRAFLENIQLMSKLTTDSKVSDEIDAILAKFL